MVLFALTLSCLPFALTAYREGPAPHKTGGFGDPTCHECHFDNPLNAAGGSLAVTGLPTAYAPGRAYNVTIRLERPASERGGFEGAARFTTGELSSKQAGAWRLLDNRVQTIASESDPTLLFVQHTTTGSLSSEPGTHSWRIEWTAPAVAAGPVQFNIAANAADDDASALGDFVYTREIRVPAQ